MSGNKISIHKNGEIIGHYTLQSGMITVHSPNGESKTTHQSSTGDNDGLARLMLSEPWAHQS